VRCPPLRIDARGNIWHGAPAIFVPVKSLEMPPRPFRLGRSLTGFGIFATRPIKKRTRVAEYKGPILTQAEADRAERRGNRYLYEVSKNRTIDGTPHRNIARYFNHSCNPNAESIIWRGRVFIKSLRDIKPGEEIVYDYGTDYLKNVIGRSNCKCSRCRRRRAKKAREARALKKRREARAAAARKAKRRKTSQ
jgi:SET domain-containing protein